MRGASRSLRGRCGGVTLPRKMQIYLPVAELSVNALLILGLGGLVGFVSGLFGVGGGFLMAPLLMFIGVPAVIAVGTEASQIVAASVLGVIAHWRRGNIDYKMGLILVAGGIAGSTLGVLAFRALRGMGQIDVVISLSYVVFLGGIGALTLIESVQLLRGTSQAPAAAPPRRKLHRHLWIHGLPLKMRFRRSKLYISAMLPAGLGFFVGIMMAIMGVGGGFLLVPALIYLLGMPSALVVGTALFQIILVAANTTLLQAMANQTVDVVLALMLLFGSIIGAQFGARAGAQLHGERLRGLLALMVLAVCGKLVWDLVAPPADPFTLVAGGLLE